MRRVRLVLALCIASIVLAPRVQAQAPAKPGPEHERMKKMEGTWDATVKFAGMESKGVMTYKMELGGFFLVSEFKGEIGGAKFEGKGIDTYDPAKKKYVNVWADSMGPSLMTMEGTMDKDGKLTMSGDGPGQDGKPVKYTSTFEWKDDDTTVMNMSMADKDGKDQPMLMITYKRKK